MAYQKFFSAENAQDKEKNIVTGAKKLKGDSESDMFNMVDLIIKKRDGFELLPEEIKFFINGAIGKSIPDYQISAMLMAIFLKGMNEGETACITKEMVYSGEILDLSEIPGIKVDKHSTGGIGDTTTLILAPLVASCGLPVIKMSGRGLGFTGGTLDKMESIGLKIDFSMQEAIAMAKKSGLVVMGQTANLAPADKILYALRDVTGTVENISMIAASIMSKKIAAGADVIVLDVKCGSGAFMKDFSSARALAKEMVAIGRNVGKKVVALITNMDEPLGLNIGNCLEAKEAIEILKGEKTGRLLDVSIELGSYMLLLGNKAESLEEAKEMLLENIKNGKGYEKFLEFVKQQSKNFDGELKIKEAAVKYSVKAKKAGYIYKMNAAEIGRASIATGAGRLKKDDEIDYTAGIIMKVKLGDYVNENDEICEIHSSNVEKCKRAEEILLRAIDIENEKPKLRRLILDVVN